MKIRDAIASIKKMIYLLRKQVEALGESVKMSDPEVIISLTTIEYRLPKLHLVVRSLLDQSVSFKKVVLWVNEDLESSIPKSLRVLESKRFEICLSKGHSSHRKLVETLKIYPEDYIVTCDDDLMYPEDWLERLLLEHKKHPKAIVAHMCRAFRFDDTGILMPYKKWKSEIAGDGSDRTLALGWGGILYPPHSLHEDVLNESLYMKLAPKADDFWFKAMAYKKGTHVYKSSQPNPEPIPIPFTQKYSLMKGNIDDDGNRKQWLDIAEYYGIEIN